jgi:hypothetical protein
MITEDLVPFPGPKSSVIMENATGSAASASAPGGNW